MTALRVVWRLFALTAFTCAAAFVLAWARLLGRVAPRGLLARENRIARRWARGVAALIGMRVTSTGPRPRPPFLLVSNHLSYVDVIAFMSEVDARLLSKADVRDWPVLGALASFGGTLFVDRTRRADLPRVISEIRARLDQGRGVIFFPEGTSSAGLEVMPFKPSLFEVAARGELEVTTACLRYVCPPGEPAAQWSVCWWGDMPFAAHFLGLLRLSGFEAELTFGEERLRDTDRKRLALRAERAVRGAFRPVCVELGPEPGTRGAGLRVS